MIECCSGAAAQMQGGEAAMDVGSIGGEAGLGGELDSTRKLVILGLPWETTEGSLEGHFSQIGPLQARAPLPLPRNRAARTWRAPLEGCRGLRHARKLKRQLTAQPQRVPSL